MDVQLPSARSSEEALLGAILIDPQIMDKISIAPASFYDVGHQLIYSTMRSIGSRELDVVTLSEMLERKGKLEWVGGQAYLISLVNKCQQTYNYEIYERAIIDTATRRRVIDLCGSLAGDAYNEVKNINDSISIVVSELVKSAKPKGGASHITEYLRTLYAELEERAADPKEIFGLATGMEAFDRITAGFQRGEEFLLAGQPGTGKSLLAFQWGCGMAERGYPGAVYSLEMTGVAMLRRRLSAMTKIKTYNLRSGVDMNKYWNQVAQAIEAMEKLPIYISDASDWTTLQIRADLSRLIQQNGIEWFIVDYHDLLGDPHGNDAIEKSANISQELKAICKDLNLAGIVIQSLNKAGYHITPTMANLSGSTKVMHTSDHIALMSVDKDNENIVHLNWDKVREGSGKRSMKLYRTDDYPAFYDVMPDKGALYNDYTR